ncbi:MAG: hypothetical protein ACO1SV_13620 [Fimbriimonas sp.]
MTIEEKARRDAVMARILDDVRSNRTIKLPPFDSGRERPSDRYALLSIGIEANDYSGIYDGFRYQFEGEEDLLHLIVTHAEGERVSAEEGQRVAAFVLRGLPPALIWLRPGEYSQHFYFGHDELLSHLEI